ncbi:ABC transporter ATP-binding protein [Candidatus Woesearchaeota archaeon]|nr:ABC transporter ATP-binding protein [Candidatus Woesearchaeota archaeon]
MMILQVEGLHKSFGGVIAVKNCSFQVEEKSITALIGPNGAGKTTVFNVITGFMKQEQGRILWKGRDITFLLPHQRAQQGITRTFQTIRLFPKMSVMENMLIASPNVYEKVYHVFLKNKKMREQERMNREEALKILERVGLKKLQNEKAGNLSYGQQKLLEIARAMYKEPVLLMLDEPAAGVNPSMLKKIRELLLELKKKGTTILFIEHDMEFVMNIADKIIVLDYGEEIAIGKPGEIRKNKRVIDAYLGGDV